MKNKNEIIKKVIKEGKWIKKNKSEVSDEYIIDQITQDIDIDSWVK